MTDKEFDSLLRERLDGFEMPLEEGSWAALERKLDRRATFRVVRRSAVAALAVAASVAVVLLVTKHPSQDGVVVDQSTLVASTEAVTVPECATEVTTESVTTEVRPVTVIKSAASQTCALADASASTTLTQDHDATARQIETTAQTPSEQVAAAETVTPATDKTHTPDTYTKEDDTRTIDWDAILREEESNARKAGSGFHPVIALASDITSNNTTGAFNIAGQPSHASSQDGSQAGGSFPMAVSDPTFYLPISVGLQVKFPITDRLSVGTGLTYSYLVSKYEATVRGELFTNTYNQLHYLGVPVNVSFDFLHSKHFAAYASIGGMAEKCLSSRYVYGSHVDHEDVDGLQYSVMAGIGVEYWFVPRLGIYLDPSLVYYIENSTHPQPLSIRTAEPTQIRFEAGLRFRL